MQLRTDDGVTLHVQELGPGGPPAAGGRLSTHPPVILLHGLFGNLATWYFTAASELAKTRRALVYDLRGHGRSGKPLHGYDIATMVRDLETVVGHAGREVDLVGHSYGGVVALAFALRHPQRVHKVAAIEAPLPPLDTGELWSRFTLAADRDPETLLASLPAPVRDALVSGGRRAARFLESVRFLTVESSLRRDLARAEMSDAALASLGCPLLAVYGTESSVRPSGERLARVVPGARHVEIAGGHDLPQETPLALTQELVRFFHG